MARSSVRILGRDVRREPGCLRRGALVRPDDCGPYRVEVLSEKDCAHHLTGQADRIDLAGRNAASIQQIGRRRHHSAPPQLRILPGAATSTEVDRVRGRRGGNHPPGHIVEGGLVRGGAYVMSDDHCFATLPRVLKRGTTSAAMWTFLGSFPSMRSATRSIAFSPIARKSCRTLDSGGAYQAAPRTSSKPMTAMSSGTRRPASDMAWRSPSARWSFPAKTARGLASARISSPAR